MKKYIAEFVGTWAIVFFGTGAILINQEWDVLIGQSGISLAFGFAVMIMIYLFGKWSGAHFNPAVTLALASSKLFPGKQIAPYISSQIAGGLLASLLLKFIFPHSKFLGATEPSGSELQSLMIEILLAFILMLAILFISTSSTTIKKSGGVLIGLIIFLEAFYAGPLTGASMNPARSIAPAIVSGQLSHLWIYLIGPVTGAQLSVLVLKLLNRGSSQEQF